MTELAAITRDYQILLEKHRKDPDCEETWELLAQTRAMLFKAWMHAGA